MSGRSRTEMNDEKPDWTREMVRKHYHPPPPTPRDEIWSRLEARLEAQRRAGTDDRPAPDPRDRGLEAARNRRRARVGPVWLAMAATAVLAAGVGIGRWSRAPVANDTATVAGTDVSLSRTSAVRANRAVAVEHLSRSEPLLTLVKSEVARGSVDREVGEWAQKLLGHTRFLLDSGLPMDPEVVSLLEDLELVLLQATLVAGGGVEGERARQELELLEEGLTEGQVLPRIQAVIPTVGAGMAGS